MALKAHDEFSAFIKTLTFVSLYLQDEKTKEIHNLMEMEDDGIDLKFKQLFDYIQHGKPLPKLIRLETLNQ